MASDGANLEAGGSPAQRRGLVKATTERLSDLILAQQPDTQIGSLPDLARQLGVGIVTVQQAARILEHQGLLEVRRGPGGGYYGRRPDAAVLERSLSAFMRTQPASWQEALDMTSLLFNELVAAAAGAGNPELHPELRAFTERLDNCSSAADVAIAEQEFQDLLFRMVNRPLFELLTRVTLRISTRDPSDQMYRSIIKMERWKTGRRRIIDAILQQDEELARFEADRNNRQILLEWLRRQPTQP